MAVCMKLSMTGNGPRLLLVLWLWLWLATAGTSYGQVDSLGSLLRKVGRYQQAALPEKLFLHLDRPVYNSGETMWFKVYVADGTYNKPLALSSIAYVEVLDAQRSPVLQGKIALKKGTGQGSFLLPASLASGNYTVRAYTSWMKNFGPEAYFHSTVTVLNTFAASGASGQDSATYDAQFFPEGGNLVKGLQSKVAFKVTDKSGKGIAAEGKVLNQNGAVVATFRTLRLGMGTFTFTPATDQGAYTAVLTLNKNQIIRRKLPRVYEQGYVMRLDDPNPDQLTLVVNATNNKPESVFLLGHSRQKTVVALKAELINNQAVFVVNKARLLEGVSHFTLFNAAQRPVCERLYFKQPKHQLSLHAQADKGQYTTRDKVVVQVAAPEQQTPLAASLSMAVYRLDSLNTVSATTIDRYLLLSADLKGSVENPDYYFTATGSEAAAAADNLMLTQGWSRFRWEDILTSSPKPFQYLPEPNGLLIQGQLTQIGTNKPQPRIMTYLASPGRITVRLGMDRRAATCSMGWWVGPSSPSPMLSWVNT